MLFTNFKLMKILEQATAYFYVDALNSTAGGARWLKNLRVDLKFWISAVEL